MTEPKTDSQPRRALSVRFSLGSLLFAVTVGCLTTALVLSYLQLNQLEQKLDQTERELSTLQPLRAEEVARQFENRTTLGPISTTVQDVRYSPEEDTFKVDFSWTDATTGKTWHTDVKLKGDGYGAYIGQIRNGPFLEPLGAMESFTAVVQGPSPLEE